MERSGLLQAIPKNRRRFMRPYKCLATGPFESDENGNAVITQVDERSQRDFCNDFARMPQLQWRRCVRRLTFVLDLTEL